jgi:hypothetical protein
MVVGSKAMKGSMDQRPLLRRAATRVINGMLRVALDFRGTDTHGLKAFRRGVLLPVVDECVIDQGSVRQRAGDPRRADGAPRPRDPDPPAREAPAGDQPHQARARRDARPREADVRDPVRRQTVIERRSVAVSIDLDALGCYYTHPRAGRAARASCDDVILDPSAATRWSSCSRVTASPSTWFVVGRDLADVAIGSARAANAERCSASSRAPATSWPITACTHPYELARQLAGSR